MSTQYDHIQGPYDYIRTLPIAQIERENVHDALAPFIQSARVLELACGSGFYTYDFLKWGAGSVLGVDISPAMLDEARRLGNSNSNSNSPDSDTPSPRTVHFLQADCSKPTAYPEGPFDLIFGAWLLNYAPDRAGLVEMFRTVALNLRPGGRFVSVTVPPASDVMASIEAELAVRPPPAGSGALWYSVLGEVEEGGRAIRVQGETPVGEVVFDCFYLRREVYVEAAREAGLTGELRWGVTSVPERFLEGEGGGGGGAASMEELRSYVSVPNYGVLVVEK